MVGRATAFEGCIESTAVLHFMQPLPAVMASEPRSKKVRVEESKGAGKGGGKVPQALLALGCVSRNSKGLALCFNFNLKKCPQKGKCSRGLHVCAVKGCHQQHPALDCGKHSNE